MADDPPPPYASYPRGDPLVLYGTPDKLQALSKGYFGLIGVFILNFVLLAAAEVVSRFLDFSLSLALVPVFGLVALLTYPLNRQIAFGKDWPNRSAWLASVLMGLNSALFCGIFGYAIMQWIVLKEMMRYGIKSGYFEVSKREVDQVIAARRVQAANPIESLIIPPDPA
jgi:hypothetical protein